MQDKSLSRKERRALRRAVSSHSNGIRAETSLTERELLMLEKLIRVVKDNKQWGIFATDRHFRQLDGQMMRIQDSEIDNLAQKFDRVAAHIHLQVKLEGQTPPLPPVPISAPADSLDGALC